MNLEQFLVHHSDDTMEPVDIVWEWVPSGNYGYWQRDPHHEALKVLREAGMLAPEHAGVSPLPSKQEKG